MIQVNVEAKHAYCQTEWRIYNGSAATIAMRKVYTWSVLEIQAKMHARKKT